MNETRNRYLELDNVDRRTIDALKGIGILWIVLVHYGLNTTNSFIGSFVFQGARGVQLMFLINGFLIFNSLDKNQESEIKWRKKKFIRLIPMYYFFTILWFLLYRNQESYWLGSLSDISIANLMANLLFIHGLFPYYINSININWFIADLAIFYIIAPKLYKVINSLEKALIAVLLAFPTVWILEKVMMKFKIISIDSIWNDYVEIIGFHAEFPVILLGILVYYVVKYIRNDLKIIHKKFFSFSCFCTSFILAIIKISNGNNFVVFNTVFSFGIIFFIIFIGQMIYPIKIISNRLWALFGKHSFGIYLLHIFIIRLWNRLGIRRESNRLVPQILSYVLLVCLTLFLSLISEYVLENKGVNLLNNFRIKIEKKLALSKEKRH